MTIYAAYDPAAKSAHIALSAFGADANLIATPDGTASYLNACGDTYRTTGKLYCEIVFTSASAADMLYGLSPTAGIITDGNRPGANDGGYSYSYANTMRHNGADVGTNATWTINDIMGLAWDADAGTLRFFKNGTEQAYSFTGVTGAHRFVSCTNATGISHVYFGTTGFNYAPPSGYVGWATGTEVATPGNGAGTLPAITGYGARVAAGAGVLPAIGGSGGYNGIGAGTLPAIHGSGTGGHNGGAGTLPALASTGTGHQAHYGVGVLGAITAAGTGYDSSINTVAATLPAITLSSAGYAGEVITFAGTIPAITLECHTKDARLTLPAPTLSATLLSGTVITVEARIAAPILVATLVNPAVIIVASTVPAIRLSASLATGQLATAILTLRPPSITAQILTGNVATVLATIPAPIMEAAGYPAYTITFAGTLPAPRLTATLSAAVTAAFRTWVLNTKKGALTEYGPEWAMNSYCVFNGKVLGCTSSGIVELGTQALDNATAISSTVKSGQDNFGSSVIKRLPRAYIDYTTGGDARFALITTEGGRRVYALDWNRVTGSQQRRVPIGQGPKSVRWQWEYTNVDGADFDLGAVLAYPKALRRRVQ